MYAWITSSRTNRLKISLSLLAPFYFFYYYSAHNIRTNYRPIRFSTIWLQEKDRMVVSDSNSHETQELGRRGAMDFIAMAAGLFVSYGTAAIYGPLPGRQTKAPQTGPGTLGRHSRCSRWQKSPGERPLGPKIPASSLEQRRSRLLNEVHTSEMPGPLEARGQDFFCPATTVCSTRTETP